MGAKKKKQRRKQKKHQENEDTKIEDKNEINKEEEKAEKKIIIKDISNKSTKEEIAIFFENNFNINKDISDKFIKEYISGDILPHLTFEDFKFLGLNLDSIISWNTYFIFQ